MSVKDLLQGEIEGEIEALGEMTMGTEEHKIAIDGLTKLLDKYNEIDRNEMDYLDKAESRQIESDLKEKQMVEERKDHITKNCLTAASIITGIGMTVWGTIKSFEFEREGNITTIMGRGFINKLLPKK